jgi:hypothetical protein
MEIKVPGKDDLILVKSNMMDQFSISANGERVIMKPQDFETGITTAATIIITFLITANA